MKFNEACKLWQMTFELEDDTLTDNEERFVRAVLHTAGDIAQLVNTLPLDEVTRHKALQAIAYVIGQAQTEIEAVVQHAAFKHMLRQPLGEGFSYQDIFGRDIDAALMAFAENEAETKLLQDYLILEEDIEGGTDGDEDDIS